MVSRETIMRSRNIFFLFQTSLTEYTSNKTMKKIRAWIWCIAKRVIKYPLELCLIFSSRQPIACLYSDLGLGAVDFFSWPDICCCQRSWRLERQSLSSCCNQLSVILVLSWRRDIYTQRLQGLYFEKGPYSDLWTEKLREGVQDTWSIIEEYTRMPSRFFCGWNPWLVSQ